MFRVQVLGFRVYGLGFRVHGLGNREQGSGLRFDPAVDGLNNQVSGNLGIQPRV